MTACRQQIRDRVAALIGTTTTVGDRVYSGRGVPPTVDQLPCLTITTPRVRVRPANTGGVEDHRLRLDVTLWLAAGEGAADRLDALAATIHGALMSDRLLGLPLTSFEARRVCTRPITLGETAALALSLIYRVCYRNPAGGADRFV